MTTYYTDDVLTGKTTDFGTYARKCIEAFDYGQVRDDEYHRKMLLECMDELKLTLSISSQEILESSVAENRKRMDNWSKEVERIRDENSRLSAMLKKARRFRVPTPEHERYHQFLVEQLESQMEDEYPPSPKLLSSEEWHQKRIDSILWDIKYHADGWMKCRENIEKRDKWLLAIEQSIREVELHDKESGKD